MEISAEQLHVLNIDSRTNRESHQANPIEKTRRPTNRWFMFVVFTPISVLWLTTCISGFFANHDRNKRETLDEYKAYINAPVTKISFTLPVALFLCIVTIGICLFAYEKLTKICIYISSALMILGAISCCLGAVQLLLGKSTKLRDSIMTNLQAVDRQLGIVIPSIYSYALICALPNLFYTIANIISFFKVDKRILCDLTNHSCRLILRSPSSLLFTVLITILKFLVFSFTLNAMTFDLLSNRQNFHGIYASFILIGGLSMANVINNFARMVISEYTINSFWTKEAKISIAPIAMKVLRNHMGTAMIASTMFVSFASILQAFKHKPTWRIKENYIFYIVTKCALATAPDTALIFTSIYGTGFLHSYQKTFDTVLRRSKVYMAMLLVIDGVFMVVYMGLIIPIVIMVTISVGHIDSAVITPDLSRVVYGFLYSYLAFELLISSTMKAQLINKIITLNKEDSDVEEINLNRNE